VLSVSYSAAASCSDHIRCCYWCYCVTTSRNISRTGDGLPLYQRYWTGLGPSSIKPISSPLRSVSPIYSPSRRYIGYTDFIAPTSLILFAVDKMWHNKSTTIHNKSNKRSLNLWRLCFVVVL